ncbi:hypothetical protein [Alicyclobacillus macrosporangiidus]|uniref:hypothetical protein n=1 Tax=Alicyclobacillus macrosporangiidus TaxID=392015 RepID=UPI000690F6EA|nr:hypothetical protein [Alicyclobacillus macrosporangiidus]
MLLRVLDQGQEDGDFAKRVAEKVGRWLMEHGLIVTSGAQQEGVHEIHETRDEREVPRNPVTSFLQRWDDD